MNFQEKLFGTGELGGRAASHVEKLKGSLSALNHAGHELNKVARRHAASFVKQNSSLVTQLRDDVTALARSTFSTLQKGAKTKAHKPAAKRQRKSRAA
jgi:hypothetical protein